MKVIFISDAHLKHPDDAGYRRLMRFFEGLRGRGHGTGKNEPDNRIILDQLVIAGDFFDFWFARGDSIYPGFRPIVDRIVALKREGVRISICEGNHDFFLDDYFTKRLGIEVYPGWVDFEIDGLRILVSHGDTVDRTNWKYLALRRFLRSSAVYGLQRLAPQPLLWRVARLSSEMSKEMSDETQDRLESTMHRFARGKFAEGYDAVILGHCHKVFLHEEMCDGKQKTFATLGDWLTHDSYLTYDCGRFMLNRLAPGE